MTRTHRLLVTLATAAAALAVAPAAHAGLLVSSARSCDENTVDRVFLPWLDVANYTIAPGGAAESADGWTFTGGAQIADGQEPWQIVGGGTSSARIPANATATTGAMCVGVEYPTLRFFARSTGTNLLSSLRVEVLFEDTFGNVITLPVGLVTPTMGTWQTPAPMVVLASLLPLLPGARTAVAFRFVPQGAGTWQVDDVHVDPWRTR